MRARELAARTPPSRNRYVDFLRALSIAAVVSGHWLIAAPHFAGGRLQLSHMLAVADWTQWLTWGFQVMPVFFMVGGFSNKASFEAASRAGTPYGDWVASRLRRLVGPVLPLLGFWAVAAFFARRAGVAPETIRIGSQAALVPVWFLAVYVLVILATPLTLALWRRHGTASFWGLAAAAVGIDALRFAAGIPLVGWLNYLFVWLAVHQTGYLWHAGRFAARGRTLLWMACGGLALAGLVVLAGYPRSMVGVPGDPVSNTMPPSLAMLALGMLQGGLLLACEPLGRRWLARPGPWTATIVVNASIMTVYLWHLTAMIVVVATAASTGGAGLHLAPGSGAWWASRPIWMVVLAVALVPFVALFGRFERPADRPRTRSVAAWRVVASAVLVCTSLALLALDGIGSDGPLGVRAGVLALAAVGALLGRG